MASTIELTRREKNDKTFYQSKEIRLEELRDACGELFQLTADAIEGEMVKLQIRKPYGDKVRDLYLSNDGRSVSTGLFLNQGKSGKTDEDYSFLSTQNISIGQLQRRLGSKVRLFVREVTSEKPRAPKWNVSFAKPFTPKDRQSGDSQYDAKDSHAF